jgi:hypothetical protein
MNPSSLSLSETEAHKALQTVDKEKKITSNKITQVDRFRQKVRRIETVDDTAASGFRGTVGGGVSAVVSTQPDGSVCGDIVEAFEETLDRCEKGTSLETTMSGELGREIAALLLRDEEAELTSDLKGSVLHSVDERKSQLRVLREALETEEESVKLTVELVESIDESLITEGTLINLGFDELRQRHGSLICLKEDCENRIQERQQTLSRTTKETSAAGLRHMSLVEYLYENLSAEHPVLSTLTEAMQACEENEYEVREHICKVM